jgi:HK97 gp10 family phage protein
MAATVHIDQREIDDLITKFSNIKDIVNPKRELRKTFIKAAKPIVSAIQAKAPLGETGELKKSIGVIPYLGSKSGKVFIGVKKNRVKKKLTAFYAMFLEFGTRYIKKGKHDFFFKSAEPALNSSLDIITNDLKTKIEKVGR